MIFKHISACVGVAEAELKLRCPNCPVALTNRKSHLRNGEGIVPLDAAANVNRMTPEVPHKRAEQNRGTLFRPVGELGNFHIPCLRLHETQTHVHTREFWSQLKSGAPEELG